MSIYMSIREDLSSELVDLYNKYCTQIPMINSVYSLLTFFVDVPFLFATAAFYLYATSNTTDEIYLVLKCFLPYFLLNLGFLFFGKKIRKKLFLLYLIIIAGSVYSTYYSSSFKNSNIAISHYKKLMSDPQEISKKVSIRKTSNGSLEINLPKQFHIDKEGVSFVPETTALKDSIYKLPIAVLIIEKPLAFQGLIDFYFIKSGEGLLPINVTQRGEFMTQEFEVDLPGKNFDQILAYSYWDYSEYLITILFALIHFKTLDFSFFSICLSIMQMKNFSYNQNVIFGFLQIVLLDALLSNKYKFNPVLYYTIRRYLLKKALVPENCLNKLFLLQQGKFLNFKMTRSHIVKGETKMTKELFGLFYFSGAFSSNKINTNMFSRLLWFKGIGMNILKSNLIEKLYDRQGYCKNWETFQLVLPLIDSCENAFKKNLRLSGLKFSISLLRLNYYLLLHLKGIYNRKTKYFNISYIDFSYLVNKKHSEYYSKNTHKIISENFGTACLKHDERTYTRNVTIYHKAFLVNNVDNMLLYKENSKKKKCYSSKRTLTEKSKETIFAHKLDKMYRFEKFLKSKIAKVSNHDKLRKLLKSLMLNDQKIRLEKEFASKLNITVKKRNKRYKSTRKPKRYSIKLTDKVDDYTANKTNVNRNQLMRIIKDRKPLCETNIFRKTHTKRIKSKKVKETGYRIEHNRFNFHIEEINLQAVAKIGEEADYLARIYKRKKNKELKNFKTASSYVKNEYENIISRLSEN